MDQRGKPVYFNERPQNVGPGYLYEQASGSRDDSTMDEARNIYISSKATDGEKASNVRKIC
jgi:hypothetical protein